MAALPKSLTAPEQESVAQNEGAEGNSQAPVAQDDEDLYDLGFGRTGTKKGKKYKKMMMKEYVQVPTHVGSLWRQFGELSYVIPQPEQLQLEVPGTPDMDYTEVFLSPARLYVLSDHYDIETLMMLSLQKLHRALVDFNLTEERTGDFATLAEYAY
ncbi:Uu.00g013130.m01.CDS01 [Anthostomella pinea]|uniref:Uu.00g013130.m01.CDS01 n=1 Tax=Anthostomella pinea TaxID=933095 RepID=A0AAI8VY16_9PEZI|nr:Uu.00g013130.m01.CDS01 [Anthostomella pinea]